MYAESTLGADRVRPLRDLLGFRPVDWNKSAAAARPSYQVPDAPRVIGVMVRDENGGEDNAALLEIRNSWFCIARVDYDGCLAVSNAPYVIVG